MLREIDDKEDLLVKHSTALINFGEFVCLLNEVRILKRLVPAFYACKEKECVEGCLSLIESRSYQKDVLLANS